LLKRHPIPVSAFFRHSLVLTYAFPPEILEPLVPRGLALDVFRGHAFLAVALVQTERLRPSFLPAALGRDFFLCGYRIFTRLDRGAKSKRGLRILRSDADRKWMVCAGNLLTHYNYHLCRAELVEREKEIHCTVRTPGSEADLEVVAGLTDKPALPGESPFASWAEARRFAGPLPYTFEYEEATGSIIGICATRQQWEPRPVAVEVRRNTFLQQELFRGVSGRLANAFYVGGVPYRWQRGRRLT
jgi:uncharacterized protein YqjF (DUF2071 family)